MPFLFVKTRHAWATLPPFMRFSPFIYRENFQRFLRSNWAVKTVKNRPETVPLRTLQFALRCSDGRATLRPFLSIFSIFKWRKFRCRFLAQILPINGQKWAKNGWEMVVNVGSCNITICRLAGSHSSVEGEPWAASPGNVIPRLNAKKSTKGTRKPSQ